MLIISDIVWTVQTVATSTVRNNAKAGTILRNALGMASPQD